MNKTTILAFIIGGIVAAFCFHAYTVYQMHALVARHDVAIGEIVNFINKATAGPNQPAPIEQK